MQLLIGISISL
uniref:AGPLS3 n=1 Tax=Arundo donax TaxID=35708 RepID=A0A0A9F5W4_ARUDO